jgi:hypothetical protein
MVGTVAAITSSVGVVLLPPGPGLLTETCPKPKLCKSAAVSATWSVVPLTNGSRSRRTVVHHNGIRLKSASVDGNGCRDALGNAPGRKSSHRWCRAHDREAGRVRTAASRRRIRKHKVRHLPRCERRRRHHRLQARRADISRLQRSTVQRRSSGRDISGPRNRERLRRRACGNTGGRDGRDRRSRIICRGDGRSNGLVVEEGELLPLQPASKERVKIEPTRNRTLRRTSPPEKTKRSFRRTTSGGRRLKPRAALFYRKRSDSIWKLLRCLGIF